MKGYILTIIFLLCFLAACKIRPHTQYALNRSEILIKYKWANYKFRVLTYKDSTGVILHDTTYTPDSCYMNALFIFSSDSLVKRTFECFDPVYHGEGKWFFSNDSVFCSSIFLKNSYTDTLYQSTNFGIPQGKVISFTEKEIAIKSFSKAYQNDTTYNIYYLKSVN